MEFFKKEPEEPPNDGEIEYYKPETPQNGLVTSVSFVNPSPPKPKAAKKRKKTRRFVYSTPKRRNQKKKEAVSVEQDINFTSLEDPFSNVIKEKESCDSSDTVILSDENSNKSKLTFNKTESPQLYEALTSKSPLKVGSPKTRKRKGKRAASRRKKLTTNGSLSTELPVPPETFVAYSTEVKNLPNSNIAAPSQENSLNLSDAEMVLNNSGKRSKPQSSRCRKKQNTAVKTPEYSSLQETINFVATGCFDDQDLDNFAFEKPLKKTARKKTGGKLPSDMCKMAAPYYENKVTVLQNPSALKIPEKFSLLPGSTSSPSSKSITKTYSKRLCLSRTTSEDLPPHVNLTFEEDVSEKQNFPEDISNLLGFKEKPVLNLNPVDLQSRLKTPSNSEQIASKTTHSKVNSSFTTCDNSDSNSSVSFLPHKPLSEVPTSQVTIKREITDTHHESDISLIAKDPMVSLNIKKEIIETNASESASSLTKVTNASDKVREHLEIPQRTVESAFTNAVGSFPIKHELESVPGSQILNAVSFPTSVSNASTSTSSSVIEKEPVNSVNQINLNTNRTLTHESEVSILTVKEKEKQNEIEVICLDDSSSDSISLVASESNGSAPKTVTEGPRFDLNNKLDLPKTAGIAIKSEIPLVAEKELRVAERGLVSPLPSTSSQLSVPNSRVIASEDNSVLMRSSPTPSNGNSTFGEAPVNASISSSSKNVAVGSQALEINVINIKKEIDDHSCSDVVGGSSKSNPSPVLGPMAATNVSSVTIGPSELSNVDRCIESVIQNGKVTETVIEHPLDLLQSIKKEVLEDGDIDLSVNINSSFTPVSERVNDLVSNSRSANTSPSIEKQDMGGVERVIDRVNLGSSIETNAHNFSLESNEASRTSIANENTDTPLEPENSSVSNSINKSSLFEFCTDISKTVATNDVGSVNEQTRVNFNNINNFQGVFENTLGSEKSCELNTSVYNATNDSESTKELNFAVSEHDNDSKCSFSSATSCSVSENRCVVNQIGEKENSLAFDFEFAECVTKYLRKIRNETENSKKSDESSKDTDSFTALKDYQCSEVVKEKVVEEASLLPEGLAHDTVCEQGSQDGLYVKNSLEKFRLNMDRYLKEDVPSYLEELYEEENLLQNREKRSSYEIFPYDIVASNLRAAAERSFNSIKKGDEIEFRDFPVVEEEIECYYRLLNVEPRLISTSGVDEMNGEKKAAECASDIEAKSTCELNEENENKSASESIDSSTSKNIDSVPSKNIDSVPSKSIDSVTSTIVESVTSEKTKVVVEDSNMPSNFEGAEKDEVEVIEVMSDDPDNETTVVAPVPKSVLDSNAKDAGQTGCVSNGLFSSIVLENIKQESNNSEKNIEAEMEVDLELRQLACESMKNLSSAETENSDLLDLNFMNRVPMSSRDNLEETFPSKLAETTVSSLSNETPVATKLNKDDEILLVDLTSPVPSPKPVAVEENTVCNDTENVSSNIEVLNISSEVECEETKNKEAVLDVQKQPLSESSAEALPQKQSPVVNSETSPAFPAIDMSVTDLLSILQTAKSIPPEPPAAEVRFVQSYDYGHGIQQKSRDAYSEPAYCSTGRDFFPPNPPSVQFEIVHEYGHKPPVDSRSESPQKKDLGSSNATACEDEGSEDEFYTVESEIICNSDAEEEDLESTEAEKTVDEKSTKSTEEEKSTESEVKDFPQYKSRWERIMERKESENKEISQLRDCMPLKPLSEKPLLKRPVAFVQPRSQTVTEPKPASIKDSYKLLSEKANLVTHKKKKRKKEKDAKIKSGTKVKHASPKVKNKHASPKVKNKHASPIVKNKHKSSDDALLLFTPDKASKPKKRGLLPTPPSHQRMDSKDKESKRVYGRVFNRGGFLTEPSSETKQVPTPKPKKLHEKRRKRVDGKATEEFHSMINLPIIDHIPVSKVLDPRTNPNRQRFPPSFGKPSVFFKPLGPDSPELSASQRSSPLLPLPSKTPLLPDPLVTARPALLPSPLSFDKLLNKTLSSIANPKRSWVDPHLPSTSSEVSKDEEIYSPSRSLSPPSISSDSPISSGGDSPASSIVPPPIVVPPLPPPVIQPPAPPPLTKHRTRNTGCVCLPPKTLKPLVGNAVFETFNVLLLILEWNVDWLVQQQKNPEPPPISNTVHKVKNEYSTFEEYYNTYLPLVLLETWQRIYVSWTHLHQAPPYFCQVASYTVEKHSTKVKCQVVFNCMERDKGIFPEEGNIVMVKFGTKDKGGIKILGYLSEVEVDAYNAGDSNHRAMARLLKNASADHLQLLTMTFVGAYTSDDFDIHQLVRIHVLCNIKTILKQNDALLYAKESPLFGNILNPLSDGLRTVTMVTRTPDPHKVAQSVSECVKEIIQGIVAVQSIPLLTVVKSVPSSDKLLVLPPLIEKMKDSYKAKVLFCTRTSKALADIGFNLESCSAKVVIVGKRADVHQKLRKYMVDDLASNKVYEDHASNGVPFLEDSIKGDVLQKAKLHVLREADVILTLVRTCHDDLLVRLCEEGETVSRMCCILDEANFCTEPEILIPLLYGISKLILIGDPDVPSKVCSKTASKFHFNKSLFHRAYELDAMNE